MSLFVITLIIAFIVTFIVSWMAKGIIFEGINHDSYKHVNTAAHFSEWGGWPSGMHKFASGKAWMKDVGVLLLVIIQRLFKDKKGFYPVFMVSNFANAVSAVLVFLVAQSYWETNVGFFLFILYLFCFWPFQIVFVGGLQVVAMMFFLFSVFCLQQAEVSMTSTNLLWYFGSGLSFGLMNFSSASGRKFIPVFISALIYHSSGNQALPWIVYRTEYTAYIGCSMFFALAVFILFGLVILSLSYKSIIRRIYNGRLRSYKFQSKEKNDIEYYYTKAKNLVSRIQGMAGFFIAVLFLVALYLSHDESYVLLGVTFAGTITTAILLMAPNFVENLIGYFNYWVIESDWGSHYNLYNDYFKKNYGKVYQKGKEGLIWYFKFYMRMVPFHMVLYSISIVMIGWEIFENSKQENLSIILLVLISIMPIIWGEWTKGPKASLTMYTSMVPLFLPIGYAIHESSVNDWSFLGYEFSFYLWIILAISSVWNIYIFFTDTLPCRMTVTKIIKFMNNYGIKKFYTYDTSFNFPFANVIKDFYPDKYDIEYISSINKIKSGYVLVPCTSSKAAYYQSVAKIGPVGDYKADESLNSMIETREIQNYSVASFKTWGNSKYWQQTGNVVSLRDLILKEVDEETRFRGYAWLLDVEKKL